MFTDDRLRCARYKHSIVDGQFAGKNLSKAAPAPCIEVCKQYSDTAHRQLGSMHAALHGTDRDQRVYVLFLGPFTPSLSLSSPYSKNAGAEFVSKIDLA
jgi:hypothetical protein